MQNFILAGKAKTVFQIIELMAKEERAEKKARRIALFIPRPLRKENRMTGRRNHR